MSKKPAHEVDLVDVLNRVDKATDSIKSELSAVRGDIGEMKITSAKHQVVLEEHMRRTDAAEAALRLLEERHEIQVDTLAKRVQPLEQHVALWSTFGKILAALSALASIAVAIYKIAY